MNAAGSVERRERIRLFCALTLPDDVLDRLLSWQRQELGGAGETRLCRREQLHVTLAFLGHRPQAELAAIRESLDRAAVSAREPVFQVVRYRETRSVGMLVLDDAKRVAGELAADLHGRLEELGVYEREKRPWLPHVTVLRFRRPPRLHPALPELGAFSPSGAAVYHSVLRPGGAQYEMLHTVSLGG